jgi:hypothetical protein
MSAPSFRMSDADSDVGARIGPAMTDVARRQSSFGMKVFTGFMASTFLSFGSVVLLMSQNPNHWIGPLTGALIWILGLTATMTSANRGLKQTICDVTAADLRKASQLPSLSRSEAAYVRALAALTEASSLLGEALSRDLLTQLNDLVVNARTLAAQKEQLNTALGSTPLPELERERQALSARLASAPDEASRRAIEQSIQLCDGRLVRAQPLAPGLARVEAQEEVVYQTLASVESSLQQMRLTPGQTPDLQVEVEEIRRSTTEAVFQTKAVEAAVQEVVTLGVR